MTSPPLRGFAALEAPPPLFRSASRIDPLVVVAGDSDRLLGRTASGREFHGEVRRLGESLRLRWRPSEQITWPARPQLLTEGEPVAMRTAAGGALSEDGRLLVRPTGPELLPLLPAGDLPTFAGPAPLSGPLVDEADEVTGWVHSFGLGPHDAVFGGGENPAALNLRGQRRAGANTESLGSGQVAAGYLNVPWFWSSAGWSLLVVHGGAVAIDVGSSLASTMTVLTEGTTADLVLAAGEPRTLMQSFTDATGRAARLPDWAFGVWFGRCSYLTEPQLHAVIDELRAVDCPVDVVHVDCYSRSNTALAGFSMDWEVDRRRFPSGWGDRLLARGVRLSLWHNPYVKADPARPDWITSVAVDSQGEAVSTNGNQNRHLIDFTNHAVREQWQQRIRTLMAVEGASALKTDFGEEVPGRAAFADGTTGSEQRNTYSLLYQQASYEASGAVMFTRSGTAGAQRYPGHWVGDQPSTWQGFEAAVRSMLALSASGFAVTGADIGGFWNPETLGRWSAFPLATAPDLLALSEDPDAFAADVDPELLTRWAQWGALTGLMRFHGAGVREPTAYPEPFRGHVIAAARLRSRIRPYLREVAEEASATGMPMCRVMPLVFPRNRDALVADTQHMLGADVLVAPQLEPKRAWTCWVPEGEWLLADGSPVASGWLEKPLALGDIPALVRKDSAVSGLLL